MPIIQMTTYKIGGGGGWQPGANTIAYRPLETDANDYSGNNYNATLHNVIFTQTGNLKYAEVSGVSGNDRAYGVIPPVFQNKNVGTGDFTLSMRAYPVATSKYPMVFGESSSSHPYPGINIFFNESSKILFRLNNNNIKRSTSSYSSLIGAWHHIVYTRINGTCTVYIDNDVEVSPYTDTSNISQSGQNHIIGRTGTGSPQGWETNGAKFSNIICENIGWTAQEISDYYNQTKSNYGL